MEGSEGAMRIVLERRLRESMFWMAWCHFEVESICRLNNVIFHLHSSSPENNHQEPGFWPGQAGWEHPLSSCKADWQIQTRRKVPVCAKTVDFALEIKLKNVLLYLSHLVMYKPRLQLSSPKEAESMLSHTLFSMHILLEHIKRCKHQ